MSQDSSRSGSRLESLTTCAVYLKNLSPLITEEAIKDAIKDVLRAAHILDPESELIAVEFREYPGSSQRFCHISLRSSRGVTAAMGLNQKMIMGVPLVATVIDPSTSTASPFGFPGALSLGSAAGGGPIAGLPMNDMHMAAMQAASLALQGANAPISTPIGASAPLFAAVPGTTMIPERETESQVLARTVHIEPVPEDWEPNRVAAALCELATSVFHVPFESDGARAVVSKDNVRLCLIELSSLDMAQRIRCLPSDKCFFSGVKFLVRDAMATVNPCEPDGVSFEPPTVTPVPVAYQQLTKLRMAEKIARARETASKLSSKTHVKESDDNDRRSLHSVHRRHDSRNVSPDYRDLVRRGMDSPSREHAFRRKRSRRSSSERSPSSRRESHERRHRRSPERYGDFPKDYRPSRFNRDSRNRVSSRRSPGWGNTRGTWESRVSSKRRRSRESVSRRRSSERSASLPSSKRRRSRETSDLRDTLNGRRYQDESRAARRSNRPSTEDCRKGRKVTRTTANYDSGKSTEDNPDAAAERKLLELKEEVRRT